MLLNVGANDFGGCSAGCVEGVEDFAGYLAFEARSVARPAPTADKKRAPWQPLAPKALDLLVIDDPAFTAGIVIRRPEPGGLPLAVSDNVISSIPIRRHLSIVVSVWCRLVGSVAGYGKMSPGVFDVAAVKRVWISGQLTTFQNAFT